MTMISSFFLNFSLNSFNRIFSTINCAAPRSPGMGLFYMRTTVRKQ
jgi:hypothetical protein